MTANSSIISYALGKRKTSIAKTFLTEGTGKFLINGKTLEDFFSGASDEKELIKKPFILLDLLNKFDTKIEVKGGGVSSQLDAIQLGISKALSRINLTHRQILSRNAYLNRDSRIKERRKYGLKKARKASQYSKR